jgi:uncharacterized protein YutE (UPF0331/DUF86 family)
MVRFRNRLVHTYWNVDTGQLYGILKEGLADVEKFKDFIVTYIKKEEI